MVRPVLKDVRQAVPDFPRRPGARQIDVLLGHRRARRPHPPAFPVRLHRHGWFGYGLCMYGGALRAGAWQVDAARLRSTLDELRTALARPQQIIGGEITSALGHDLKRITASVVTSSNYCRIATSLRTKQYRG